MINEVEAFDAVAALDQMDQWESNARTYARRFRAVFTEGDGMILTASDGRQFIDCLCGAGTLLLGHNHPVVIGAIQDVIARKRPLHMLDMRTIEKYEFMRKIMSVLPPGFARDARIQFCGPAGTDCVEAAVKLCKTATRRSTMIAFQGGFHGHSQGALALMGSIGPKVPSLAADCHFFAYPCEYRNVFVVEGEPDAPQSQSVHGQDDVLGRRAAVHEDVAQGDPRVGAVGPLVLEQDDVHGPGRDLGCPSGSHARRFMPAAHSVSIWTSTLPATTRR